MRFRDSWLIRIGALLLLIGSGPLLGVIFAAKLGLTRDPNPNPVGFGILAVLTFLPSIGLIIAGVVGVLWRKRSKQRT
jgi:hypothetical protein